MGSMRRGPTVFLFLRFRAFWAYGSWPDALVTFSSTAPAHPHATKVAVYPALFNSEWCPHYCSCPTVCDWIAMYGLVTLSASFCGLTRSWSFSSLSSSSSSSSTSSSSSSSFSSSSPFSFFKNSFHFLPLYLLHCPFPSSFISSSSPSSTPITSASNILFFFHLFSPKCVHGKF